jgi:predicted permease
MSFDKSGNILWWETLWQDIRFAPRLLRRSAGLSVIAILTIALGIGATAAIFSVVDATLLHPLPYPHPEQLVRLEDDLTGAGSLDVGMSVPEWQELERAGIFTYVSPMATGESNLTGSDQPQRAAVLAVAPNYFAVLGMKPQLGRMFDPNDRTRGFTLEVVISDGLWKRGFGSDPQILTRSVRIDNDLYRVIGVMPPGFHDPGRSTKERNVDLWLAVGFAGAPFPDPPIRSVRLLPQAIGRLAPGVTLHSAQSRLDAFVTAEQRQFAGDYPAQSGWRLRAVPLQESLVGDVRRSLLLSLGAVGIVLLIGCVNIANLLLARASARRGEVAIRQALGASRVRLIRQSLAESLLLALTGGLVGMAILVGLQRPLRHLVPDSLPRLDEISINWTVLLFALGASVLAAAIFGLVPAIGIGRLETRGAKISRQQARARRVLVITEFALSLVLMIAACLLLRSFWDLLSVRLGYTPQNVMAVRLWLPIPNDPSTDIYGTVEREAPFLRELLRRGASLSGVQEIAIGNATSVPLAHDRHDANLFTLAVDGHDVPVALRPRILGSIVTSGFFHLLGLPLKRGRLFGEQDNEATQRVAVVNEAFGRAYWPNEEAIGKRVKLGNGDTAWTTIVGVIADARTESLAEAATPAIYLSAYQRLSKKLALLVRGHFNVGSMPAALRQQVQSVNPELPVFGAEMLTDAVSSSLAERRFSMQMVAGFALTALLLAGLGIYGVIAYIVSERTREIGIRLALGAQQANIMRMILRQGLALALVGTAIGLVGALLVARLMSGLLFGVSPTDPVTFAAVAGILTAVALAACYVPARRAMRVDPTIAQRS